MLTLNESKISDINKVVTLKNEIENLNSLGINYKDFIYKIENNQSYKRELKTFIASFNNSKRKINLLSKQIKLNDVKSKYSNFLYEKRYTDYTGIDLNYFDEIK